MTPEMLQILETLKDVKNPFTFVGIAVVVGAVVRLLKTKTIGDWLDATPKWLPINRIPKERLPDVALFVGGAITFLDGWLNGKLSIGSALLYAVVGAVLGGGGASLGHQVVAKRLTLATEDPPPPAGPSRRDPEDEGLKRSPYREPAPSQLELARPKRPPIAAPDPITISDRSIVETRGFARVVTVAFSGFVFFCMASAPGCGLFSPKSVVDAVLKASDIACLMTGDGSKSDDPDAAAIACKLAQDPVLRELAKNLVGQRVAAKRAGFVWKPVAVGADGLPATDNGDGGIVETAATKDGGR